nr:TadE/TadG family type IV pilus assembly protein [uncultured Dongia sp.]
MRLIESICQRVSGRRRLDDRGVAIVEFAIVFPVLLLMTFGAIEIGMIMATQSTLEGGLKEASRYGITGQAPSDTTRIEKIRTILDKHALGLVDMSEATFIVKTYASFSQVGEMEPFNDTPGPTAGEDPDPCHDGHFDAGCIGETFTDVNGNGFWDAIGEDSAGVGGEVVAYTVTVPWHIMTPFAGTLMSKTGTINLTATIVVRNEPNLY